VPIAITDEQLAICESIRDWAARAGTVATVRELEGGPRADRDHRHWREHWAELAGLGLFGVAVPEEFGGLGCGLTELAAALEQSAAALAPGPVLSTALAGVVLAGKADLPVAKELLPGLAEGGIPVAVALDPGQLAVDGRTVTGKAGPLLGSAPHLLLGATAPDGSECWFIVDADQAGVRVTHRTAVDFSRPLIDVHLDGLTIPENRMLPGLRARDVADTAATLSAAEAAGVAAWCLRTATEYAKTREQFGRAIGSFQAVKHLCAGMLCRVEQAAAAAWDAARTADEASGDHPLAAAVAAVLALDAAVEVAKDCVQVLGGIGFTWEHDAHLYLRRAMALRQLLGGSAHWRRRVAELVIAGARPGVPAPRADDGPQDADGHRTAARELAAELADLPGDQQRVRLAESGYLAPEWPAPFGVDASPAAQLAIEEEFRAAGIRRPDLVIGGWAAPTVLKHGSDEQRERFVLPTLRGEITWCQLFSEPEAGSDLAALRTRAVREDGGWRLHGQKVWTSRATEADWAICLARTDPDVPKHKGITYFLVDMRSAGIDIRPLREITGDEMFNEVFLDGVFVPDDCVVGALGEGWKLARTTLSNERVKMGGGSVLGEDVERLLGIATERGLVNDPGVRENLGTTVAEGISVSILETRATLRRLSGQDADAESSVRKLVGVRHRQSVAEFAVVLYGTEAACAEGESAAAMHEFLLSRCLSIAGGTTQVLLNVAGERILGLPREGAK
jgi:alkylation response protein AidB-like acyl-CoA dehydrogenase